LKKLALAILVLAIGAVVFRTAIFTALGDYLVKAGPPQKADIVLVLAGDSTGNRILKAAELVREGYAPKVVVSGPGEQYDLHECDLEIPFAVRRGYPESYFLHYEMEAHSTKEEAEVDVPELRRLGAKTVLLVTSDFHTRRATKIFRRTAPDLTFYPVAAPTLYFDGGWWKNREGQKTFANEWMKTVAEWFGI